MRKTEYRRHYFPRMYTTSEVELLARTDGLHDSLSGSATKKVITRYPRGMVRKTKATPAREPRNGEDGRHKSS